MIKALEFATEKINLISTFYNKRKKFGKCMKMFCSSKNPMKILLMEAEIDFEKRKS